MGFMIAVNDDNGPDSALAPGDQLLWFGLSHREFTYGRLTLDGPVTATEPLSIVESTPDFGTGDLAMRWVGGAGPLFQVQRAATITGPWEPLNLPQSQRTYIDKGALKAGKAGFYRVQQGPAIGFAPPRCVTTPASTTTWANTSFANQTGTFTATWDATPLRRSAAGRCDGTLLRTENGICRFCLSGPVESEREDRCPKRRWVRSGERHFLRRKCKVHLPARGQYSGRDLLDLRDPGRRDRTNRGRGFRVSPDCRHDYESEQLRDH
jgi:hypothetical protein